MLLQHPSTPQLALQSNAYSLNILKKNLLYLKSLSTNSYRFAAQNNLRRKKSLGRSLMFARFFNKGRLNVLTPEGPGQETQQILKIKLEQQFQRDCRPLIAVDLDEVLSQFLLRLNDYYNKKAQKKHKISDYYRYIYADIWKIEKKEAADIVHSFFETQEFKEKIPVIPFSQLYIDKLKDKVNLVIVTSRQNVIQQQTVNWLNSYFYSMFQQVYFGNSHSLDGKEKTKYKICQEIGADLLIDDNPKYCEECSDNGMKSILFNYNNQYPWSQLRDKYQHRNNISKLTQWKQVYNKLQEIYKF